MKLLYRWILSALALLAVAYVIPTIHLSGIGTALLTALVLGLFNALLRPILILLTLPVTILTLGLFMFIINGLLFYLASILVPGFEITGFWWAVLGALVYSALNMLIDHILGEY